jgi:superfamily II DNA helicase RecQ
VAVLAMTATANKHDRKCIKESLGLKKCFELVGNPDRVNIVYQKHLRTGEDIDAITDILTTIAQGLLKDQVSYPLTIIYVPLRWCGFAYRLFDFVLEGNQYYPQGSSETPENRLFAQFHSPQTKQMKEEVLKQLSSKKSTIRVVFASVALGMGVDIRDIRHTQFKSISRKQAGQDAMAYHQLQHYIIITMMLQKVDLEFKKQ